MLLYDNYSDYRTNCLYSQQEVESRSKMIKKVNTEIVIAKFMQEKFHTVKISSYTTFESKIEKYFKPYLPRQSTQLKLKNLKDFFDFIEEQELSESSLKELYRFANDFFKFAYENKYTRKLIKIPLSIIEDKKIEIFSRNERSQLKEYLISHLDYFNFSVLLVIFSGIRIGELAALQLEDIDIENSMLHITKSLKRVRNIDGLGKNKTLVIIDDPKSQTSNRKIPFPVFFLEIIEKLFSDNDRNDYILTGTQNYMDIRTIQRRFKKVLTICNISIKNFHVLRHTYATFCLEDGMSIEAVKELMGHKNEKQTRRYIHLTASYLKMNVEKMNVS